MTRLSRVLRGAAISALVTMLAACATPPAPTPTVAEAPVPVAPPPPPSPPPPAPPPSPPPPTAASELAAGIKSYDDGDYGGAGPHLQAALDMGLNSAADRAQAHKYRAFMVCVNGREKACRDEFRLALEADPQFALAPAEATHPVWPKVLASVKAELARAAARKAPAKGGAKKASPTKAPPSKPSGAVTTPKASASKASPAPTAKDATVK